MLLAQKAYVEGGLALELYCARLVDEQHTGAADAAREAALLLEVLTPIAKSWPSEWCLEANSLAIQVHGGYGYTRDFPVEQYWRDNRLNMIHEGTHGIQALDLLGRKVVMDGGAGLKLLASRIQAHASSARAREGLAPHAAGAGRCAAAPSTRPPGRRGRSADPDEALTNATPYLQAFGHARHRLDLARVAGRRRRGCGTAPTAAQPASCRRCAYFYAYELPQVDGLAGRGRMRAIRCAATMRDEWF